MILACAAFIILILYKSKITFPQYNHDFLNHDMTNCINGIFILLVFFSHFNPYVKYTIPSDLAYAQMVGKVGQLMVTTFLFYSGYGIMESIKTKGLRYVQAIPMKRIFGTWYKFLIAVNIYLILAHYNFPLKRILLSFLSWSSVGNSNWYIFVVLVLYFIVFCSFTIFKNDYRVASWGVLIASICLILSLYLYWGRQHWWYDTILCYPAGMFASLYKEKLISLFHDRLKTVCLLWGGICVFYVGKYILLHTHLLNTVSVFVYYNIFYVLSISFIVFITTNIYIKNNILEWFGKNLFSFYILQRIPMNYLKNWGLAKDVYWYFLLSFIIAVILTYLFSILTNKIDHVVFKTR